MSGQAEPGYTALTVPGSGEPAPPRQPPSVHQGRLSTCADEEHVDGNSPDEEATSSNRTEGDESSTDEASAADARRHYYVNTADKSPDCGLTARQGYVPLSGQAKPGRTALTGPYGRQTSGPPHPPRSSHQCSNGGEEHVYENNPDEGAAPSHRNEEADSSSDNVCARDVRRHVYLHQTVEKSKASNRGFCDAIYTNRHCIATTVAIVALVSAQVFMMVNIDARFNKQDARLQNVDERVNISVAVAMISNLGVLERRLHEIKFLRWTTRVTWTSWPEGNGWVPWKGWDTWARGALPGWLGRSGQSGQWALPGWLGRSGQWVLPGWLGRSGQWVLPEKMGHLGRKEQLDPQEMTGHLDRSGQLFLPGKLGHLDRSGQWALPGRLGVLGPMGQWVLPGRMGHLGPWARLGRLTSLHDGKTHGSTVYSSELGYPD
ncbi:Hypp9656 [Branchiostoma lanceolatum]|uniref:Hypp9656 protein n=1 Tax=Branchiostoma lanceolatum TaxID=7740 RepID=A0A8S4MNJ7_BRALA|nr:Hypp9656 [Branchiostoma lanceolatum]